MTTIDTGLRKNVYKVDDKLKLIQPLLKEIEYDNDEKMNELVLMSSEIIGDIIYSMRCSRDFNFFSLVLDKVNIIIDPLLETSAACCFVKNHFEMRINPFLAFKEEFDKYMVRAFIIHETYHIILKHLLRMEKYIKSGKYHHETINIGLDVAINQYIKEFRDYDKACNIHTMAKILHCDESKIALNKNCEYYIELLEHSSVNQPTPQQMLQMIQDALNKMQDQDDNSDSNENDQDNQNNNDNENNDQNDDNNDNQQNNGNGNGGNKVVKDFGCGHNFQKVIAEAKSSPDIQEEVIKGILRDVAGKMRGRLPAGLDEVIQESIQEPVIRWQDVLRNYMGRLPIPFKKTNARLNRRQPERLDIMGKLPTQYYRIVVGIDTSGSMSDEDIQLCMSEIWHIIQSQKKKFEITVIECDAAINAIYEVKKRADFNKIKIKGRGSSASIVF